MGALLFIGTITMEQLLAHLVGDYILQSHDMAVNKTKNSYWAAYHAVMYTLPFILLTHNLLALLVICSTHFLIDRFRVAVYITKLKNYIFGKLDTSIFDLANGYPEETPAWLSTWLIIILDNTMHLIINYLALLIK